MQDTNGNCECIFVCFKMLNWFYLWWGSETSQWNNGPVPSIYPHGKIEDCKHPFEKVTEDVFQLVMGSEAQYSLPLLKACPRSASHCMNAPIRRLRSEQTPPTKDHLEWKITLLPGEGALVLVQAHTLDSLQRDTTVVVPTDGQTAQPILGAPSLW